MDSFTDRDVNIFVADDAHVANPKIQAAVGRLATWAIDGFDTVHIAVHPGAHEINAGYQNSKTGRTYVIGAVWSEESQEYTFQPLNLMVIPRRPSHPEGGTSRPV